MWPHVGQTVLGAFTLVLMAVHLWSDHAGQIVLTGLSGASVSQGQTFIGLASLSAIQPLNSHAGWKMLCSVTKQTFTNFCHLSALMNRSRMSYSLALGAVAVHAVLYGLVAGLADGPTGHLHSQARLCAPLDASLQLPALCIHCRETHGRHIQINSAAVHAEFHPPNNLKVNFFGSRWLSWLFWSICMMPCLNTHTKYFQVVLLDVTENWKQDYFLN